MLRTIDLRGRTLDAVTLAAVLPRAGVDPGTASAAALTLIEDVRDRGVAALEEQADRFDGGRAPDLRVPQSEITAAIGALPSAVRAALDEAIARVREASAAQVPSPASTELASGATVLQRWVPLDRVGLYVPGGRAVYPSSVVMNVVPAQVAGVPSLAIASPPQRDHANRVHPVILGAAGLLGIDEVYAMGGAGALAAFAYGVPAIGLEPVTKVTGPGNVFVAAAKRLLSGRVGIDSEAGPTEILVIADRRADPELVAADLVSQAEHDVVAAAVLVTDSPELVAAVSTAVDRRAAETRHASRVAEALHGPQSAIVLVDDLDGAVAVSNAYGPEHLEVQTAAPRTLLPRLTNAGAIFLGPASPVSLGDYLAGSNHVLPTSGTTRFSAGLSTVTFLKQQQVIEYDQAALAAVRPHVRALSDAEDLPAHGDAVDARFDVGE
jgi:histidinol dehydrogenase